LFWEGLAAWKVPPGYPEQQSNIKDKFASVSKRIGCSKSFANPLG
jgi:hypothetical protein